VDPSTAETLRAAAEAVTRLVELCRKGGPLYARDARLVAQVSRTAKWHLNALAALRRALDTPGAAGR
jgi:hypothetical protein